MSKKPAESNEPNITYFRPGQIIFHVSENMSDRSRVEKLVGWAHEIAKSRGISLSPSNEEFDFNSMQDFDIQPLDVSQQNKLLAESDISYKSPQAQIADLQPFSLVFANARSEKWPEFPTKPEEQADALEELLELVIFLDENRQHKDVPANLEVVSPNWLMSGSPSSPGSTGGPGAQPTPYYGPADTQEFRIRFDGTLPSIRDEDLLDKFDQEIVVAILDTAPKLNGEDKDKVLDAIYEKWVGNPVSGIKHSLIETLLGPNGRLQNVYFDDEVDKPVAGVLPDGYIRPEGHDYEMTDHGLFAAGIIHSLAPQAKLHLFQVLNRYGVGDISNIARALKKIQDDNETFPKERLIVNLSLTINFPLVKEHGKNDKMLEKILKTYSKDSESWFQRQAQPIASICNSLYAQGSKVIAAAGNNRKLGKSRPQACYPAAFESVLGVGALPRSDNEKLAHGTKNRKPASYSNRSDRPEISGITTLGGEEGEGLGVLGIYLEKFPPPRESEAEATKSTNGWGWWAGTSFATPIITGMTAAVRGFMPQLNTMEAAVVELFKARSSKTEDNEDVLDVTQGT